MALTVAMELPTGTVTFLFTDIEGSTNLARTLGPRWPQVLEEHNAILRGTIRDSGGSDLRTEGDAFFAVFGSALDAVAAAGTAQRLLAGHRWPPDGPVRVRMGLHTGEGRRGGDEYVGLDVHRAARIAAAGHGGQVLLSESTAGLVVDALPAGTSLLDLGRHRLKDFDEPRRIHQLSIDGLTVDFPPITTLETPTNLPAELTSFVGREHELVEVERLLETGRLVTLTGPGGAGKTRLALRVASDLLHRFPDGVFLVDLASITEPNLVPSAIASALGTGERGRTSALETLTIELRHRTMLLVLDNFEQVVEASGAVAELLTAAPGIRLLVTSRGRLRLRGERQFPVHPLDLPEAGRPPALQDLTRYGAPALFVDRATAVDPGFAVTPENASAVVEICRRLDGLPLAIELAASRLRLMSPAGMLERLDRSLPLLSGGSRDLPARHRTLRGTIGWSYDLLSPQMGTLFRGVCVFAGGFSLEAVASVCQPRAELGMEVMESVEALLDTGLVRQRPLAHGDVRFETLQTIREYGLELLEEQYEGSEVRRRHARYFLELAEAAAPELRGPQWEWSFDLLLLEHDNLRAALGWAIAGDDGELALRLCRSMWRFWQLHGDLTVGRGLAEQALALPSAEARTVLRARALIAAGSVAYWQLDPPAVRPMYEEALAIFQELGEREGMAEGTYNAAFVAALDEDQAEAARLFRASMAMFEDLGDRRGVADSLFGLSNASRFLGDLATARASSEEALRLHQELGDVFGLHGDLYMLGRAAAEMGDLDRARQQFLQTLALAERIGYPTGIALSFDQLADQAIKADRPARAMRLVGAANAIKEVVGGQAPPELLGLPDPMEGARQHLSEEEIRAAVEEGRAMTREEALAFAREET